jgi:hypothetical protein
MQHRSKRDISTQLYLIEIIRDKNTLIDAITKENKRLRYSENIRLTFWILGVGYAVLTIINLIWGNKSWMSY